MQSQHKTKLEQTIEFLEANLFEHKEIHAKKLQDIQSLLLDEMDKDPDRAQWLYGLLLLRSDPLGAYYLMSNGEGPNSVVLTNYIIAVLKNSTLSLMPPQSVHEWVALNLLLHDWTRRFLTECYITESKDLTLIDHKSYQRCEKIFTDELFFTKQKELFKQRKYALSLALTKPPAVNEDNMKELEQAENIIKDIAKHSKSLSSETQHQLTKLFQSAIHKGSIKAKCNYAKFLVLWPLEFYGNDMSLIDAFHALSLFEEAALAGQTEARQILTEIMIIIRVKKISIEKTKQFITENNTFHEIIAYYLCSIPSIYKNLQTYSNEKILDLIKPDIERAQAQAAANKSVAPEKKSISEPSTAATLKATFVASKTESKFAAPLHAPVQVLIKARSFVEAYLKGEQLTQNNLIIAFNELCDNSHESHWLLSQLFVDRSKVYAWNILREAAEMGEPNAVYLTELVKEKNSSEAKQEAKSTTQDYYEMTADSLLKNRVVNFLVDIEADNEVIRKQYLEIKKTKNGLMFLDLKKAEPKPFAQVTEELFQMAQDKIPFLPQMKSQACNLLTMSVLLEIKKAYIPFVKLLLHNCTITCFDITMNAALMDIAEAKSILIKLMEIAKSYFDMPLEKRAKFLDEQMKKPGLSDLDLISYQFLQCEFVVGLLECGFIPKGLPPEYASTVNKTTITAYETAKKAYQSAGNKLTDQVARLFEDTIKLGSSSAEWFYALAIYQKDSGRAAHLISKAANKYHQKSLKFVNKMQAVLNKCTAISHFDDQLKFLQENLAKAKTQKDKAMYCILLNDPSRLLPNSPSHPSVKSILEIMEKDGFFSTPDSPHYFKVQTDLHYQAVIEKSDLAKWLYAVTMDIDIIYALVLTIQSKDPNAIYTLNILCVMYKKFQTQTLLQPTPKSFHEEFALKLLLNSAVRSWLKHNASSYPSSEDSVNMMKEHFDSKLVFKNYNPTAINECKNIQIKKYTAVKDLVSDDKGHQFLYTKALGCIATRSNLDLYRAWSILQTAALTGHQDSQILIGKIIYHAEIMETAEIERRFAILKATPERQLPYVFLSNPQFYEYITEGFFSFDMSPFVEKARQLGKDAELELKEEEGKSQVNTADIAKSESQSAPAADSGIYCDEYNFENAFKEIDQLNYKTECAQILNILRTIFKREGRYFNDVNTGPVSDYYKRALAVLDRLCHDNPDNESMLFIRIIAYIQKNDLLPEQCKELFADIDKLGKKAFIHSSTKDFIRGCLHWHDRDFQNGEDAFFKGMASDTPYYDVERESEILLLRKHAQRFCSSNIGLSEDEFSEQKKEALNLTLNVGDVISAGNKHFQSGAYPAAIIVYMWAHLLSLSNHEITIKLADSYRRWSMLRSCQNPEICRKKAIKFYLYTQWLCKIDQINVKLGVECGFNARDLMLQTPGLLTQAISTHDQLISYLNITFHPTMAAYKDSKLQHRRFVDLLRNQVASLKKANKLDEAAAYSAQVEVYHDKAGSKKPKKKSESKTSVSQTAQPVSTPNPTPLPAPAKKVEDVKDVKSKAASQTPVRPPKPIPALAPVKKSKETKDRIVIDDTFQPVKPKSKSKETPKTKNAAQKTKEKPKTGAHPKRTPQHEQVAIPTKQKASTAKMQAALAPAKKATPSRIATQQPIFAPQVAPVQQAVPVAQAIPPALQTAPVAKTVPVEAAQPIPQVQTLQSTQPAHSVSSPKLQSAAQQMPTFHIAPAARPAPRLLSPSVFLEVKPASPQFSPFDLLSSAMTSLSATQTNPMMQITHGKAPEPHAAHKIRTEIKTDESKKSDLQIKDFPHRFPISGIRQEILRRAESINGTDYAVAVGGTPLSIAHQLYVQGMHPDKVKHKPKRDFDITLLGVKDITEDQLRFVFSGFDISPGKIKRNGKPCFFYINACDETGQLLIAELWISEHETLQADLESRDLFVCAFALNSDGRVRYLNDKHGGAYQDLISQCWRMIKDPNISLKEDAFRIIRARKSAKEYNARLHPELESCIVENVKLIRTTVEPYRIHSYLSKTLIDVLPTEFIQNLLFIKNNLDLLFTREYADLISLEWDFIISQLLSPEFIAVAKIAVIFAQATKIKAGEYPEPDAKATVVTYLEFEAAQKLNQWVNKYFLVNNPQEYKTKLEALEEIDLTAELKDKKLAAAIKTGLPWIKAIMLRPKTHTLEDICMTFLIPCFKDKVKSFSHYRVLVYTDHPYLKEFFKEKFDYHFKPIFACWVAHLNQLESQIEKSQASAISGMFHHNPMRIASAAQDSTFNYSSP